MQQKSAEKKINENTVAGSNVMQSFHVQNCNNNNNNNN